MGRMGKSQADAIISELIEVRKRIDNLITTISTAKLTGKGHRDYDVPLEDPEIVAERWGVNLEDEAGEIPPAVQERIARLTKEQT